MQIPVGIMMDRYGARKLLTFAALFCGVGSFFFGMAQTLAPAEFGRFLIGIGSSFAFVGMIYICSHWFPQKNWLFSNKHIKNYSKEKSNKSKSIDCHTPTKIFDSKT